MYTQFTYYTYLQTKYGVSTPTTMLKVEADMMGIRYPLRAGWRERHHDWLHRSLSHGEQEAFLAGLIKKKRAVHKMINRGFKQRGDAENAYRQLDSLQAGIDMIMGREFEPVNAAIKRPVNTDLEGCLDRLHQIGEKDLEANRC
jgi:hypothetical protein